MLGSFGKSSPGSDVVPPAVFVFSLDPGNMPISAPDIWEAVSHELGHALGLS